MCQLFAVFQPTGFVAQRSPLTAMVLGLSQNFDTSARVTVEMLYSARPGDHVWLPRAQSKVLGWLHKKNRPYSKNKLSKEK